jgi:pectin methylesterase-like acyl-CoA thioesterase
VSPQPEGLDELLLIAGEPNNPAVGLTINNPPFSFLDTRVYSTRFTTPDNSPSVSRTFKIVVSFEVTNYLQQPIYSSNPSSLNNPAALQFMVDIYLAPESCIEPPPIATQIVYVNKAGNDATADGSECNPFLTVTAAMASILDASPTKRYAISIGPGNYAEPLIHLKANVQLIGTSTLLTRLSIPFDINDPSWFCSCFKKVTQPILFNF